MARVRAVVVCAEVRTAAASRLPADPAFVISGSPWQVFRSILLGRTAYSLCQNYESKEEL
jgi:hypothetical protein